MRWWYRRRRLVSGDEGFALISVVGTMAVLMLLVLAATIYAANNVAHSRKSQDYAAAMAAAQAGIDDFLSRLNACDTHWAAPCPGSPPELARDTWATVPGSTGGKAAQYKYSVVATPATTPGLIRIKAEGKVGISTRSVTVDLRKEGFLQFIYYTDKESSSPTVYYETYASSYPSYQKTYTVSNWSCTHYSTGCKSKEVFSGLTPTGAQACARYYYSVPPASGTRGLPTQTVTTYWKRKVGGSWVDQTPVTDTVTLTRSNGTAAASCDINFVGGDVINGPMYTKDALLLMPNNGYTGPHFKGTAETYWQATYDPPPSVDTGTLSKPWRKNGSTAAPVSSGYKPTIATRVLDMPPTNASIRDAAVSGGCLYTGPTKIVLNSDGTMNVTNGTSGAVNPGCGPGNGLGLPANGVVYVDNHTGTCPGNGKSLQTYPITNDITPYDCRAGDVFVQGTLKGQLTIASANDIIVTDDLVYHQQVWNGSSINTSVTDVLGLVAQGFVKTYHPVNSSGSNLTNVANNLEIDAAILSVDNSFTVQNYTRGNDLGTLKVRGGIYQRHRGPVGTSGGSGYLKDYVYDSRLMSMPPPFFLEPTTAPWGVVGFSE
ncbi:MAG: hypothetical protein GXX79_05985 [Actinomycetales bacterium]|nr:hypothetical protein [Actinomycetales bacterium]